MRAIRVLYPFDINVQPAQVGFVATSNISDIYEIGETLEQAALHYLHALIDEILWFQCNAESLSEPLLKDFSKLQHYLDLQQNVP